MDWRCTHCNSLTNMVVFVLGYQTREICLISTRFLPTESKPYLDQIKEYLFCAVDAEQNQQNWSSIF